MPARFLFLDNDGSPTMWDANRYGKYLERVRPRLPSDLQSLTAIERLYLPSMSERSFWWTDVRSIQASGDRIEIGAMSQDSTRRYALVYAGVRKFQTTACNLRFMPTIIVHELVQLRNGIHRHTFSHPDGSLTTIHSASLSFEESPVQ
jgi:hypothetical protein